jgi:hypothetical protein
VRTRKRGAPIVKNFRFKMFKGRILVDNRDFQAADALDARFIAMSLYDACSYNCDA